MASVSSAVGSGGTDFIALFGRAPEIRAEAPGRVNLIGEHTDYNGGFVLPTVIPQRTRVELARRADGRVRAWSREVGRGSGPVEYRIGEETPRHDWLDYVQGITKVLADADHRLGGFDLRIESDVPVGSGLSSSAALEVSLLRALRQAFALSLDDVPLARLGQRAENEFVGAPVGIMDQMACTLAGAREALFLDTRTLEFDRVKLPVATELVVINSGVAHRHAGGDYVTRRRESEQAAKLLGVPQLRDLPIDDLSQVASLPHPLDRRARHVVTEDARVLEAVAAMKAGDAARLGELFYASHASMRDDYEVSIPEIDLLVDLARKESDVFGARLTGGGFGGSIVIIARAGSERGVADRVTRAYARQSGQQPAVLVPAPA
jgi:galactokinase